MKSLRSRSLRALAEAMAREIRRKLPDFFVIPSPEWEQYQADREAGLLPSSPAVKVYLDEDQTRWWESL